MTPILSVSGIGPHLVALLAEKGISTADQLATTSPAALLDIPGIGVRRAETLLAAARLVLESTPPKLSKARNAPVKAAARKAPQNAAVKDDEDNKKAAAKKAAVKKIKTKKKPTSKKSVAKKKAKERAAAKKKAKEKKVKKKAAKKNVKASKRKKGGKPKKK